MDVTTALTTLQSHISSQVSIPVRVSGMEDERPVPVLLIEDWDLVDLTLENTAFAGQAVDPDDGVEKRWFRFYYALRVEMVVRHYDEVLAHQELDNLRVALSLIREDPVAFHDHLNDLQLRGGGGIDHQFIESKETDLHQAVRLTSFHEVKRDMSNYDTLDDIVDDFTLI